MTQKFYFWESTRGKWKCGPIKAGTQMFTAAFFLITKTKQKSINWWVDKQIAMPLDNEYHLAIKRNEILIKATACMNLKNSMLGEEGQAQKTAHCVIPFIWNFCRRQI